MVEFTLLYRCIFLMCFFFIVKPFIKTFKSEPTLVILGKGLKITCEAEGVPKPNYIIRHNGSILACVKDGMKIIQSVKHSDAGEYTCNAGNILGNETQSFSLFVPVPVPVQGKIYGSLYLLIYLV